MYNTNNHGAEYSLFVFIPSCLIECTMERCKQMCVWGGGGGEEVGDVHLHSEVLESH
jgi:hypothetical protein